MEPEEVAIDVNNIVTLDMEFLVSMFLKQGNKFKLEVIKGVPEGANAVAAGIHDGTLIIVFDQPVPREVYFKDMDNEVSTAIRKEIN